ncbi:galactosyltransferase-related protein [Sphingomonas sp. PsM26]|nr:galactosyltransferase-related protein [Sphingomonas sp. PsM26]
MSVSVLTIVRGRSSHLANLIAGLERQTCAPDELVIAWMQDAPSPLPETRFPVRSVLVPGDPMPLAAARNRAAEAARGEQLILLDVDCIPAAGLVERYAATVEAAGVRLGDVLYLPPGGVERIDDDALDRVGVRHPAKPELSEDEIRATPSHGELWGLSFALSAADWRRAGGMDERYIGYGGEETDFAARLERAGVTMAWIGGARAYHQHHPIHIPPLQHFDAILRNARLFHATWGRWCMDYWLGQFAERGLIAIDDTALTVVRAPTRDEIDATLDATALFS